MDVLDHYHTVAPILERLFGPIPLVAASFPKGFDKPPQWHGPVRGELPASIGSVEVDSEHGRRLYITLSANSILWLCHRDRAIEFHSWTPAADPTRVRFARILLETDSKEEVPALIPAARTIRGILKEAGASAIPLVTGISGMALWIPFADAPEYPPVRAWLHEICTEAVRRAPQLFSIEPNSHKNGRVHLHVATNAPGRYSALPYSLRGDPRYHVCVPIRWSELEKITPGLITIENCGKRLAAGEVFGPQAEELRHQRFADIRHIATAPIMPPSHAHPLEPHGRILRGALAILQDGVARTADEILAEGIKRALFPATTHEKYVYTSLLEYIVRTQGHGHRPLVVQDPDRRFRINEPPDEWPPLPAPPPRELSPQTKALIERLNSTAHGADPTAFEIAVCDAFAQLGFAATHVGGTMNPDGYADAQLGPLGYRVTLECKTAGSKVHNPDAVEASKFREQYHAQYCALVGPWYTEATQLASELKTHGVSAWTVDDLTTLLEIGSNAYEIIPLFAPGFVSDELQTLVWNRSHGRAKRVRIICDYLQEAGWNAQAAAARQGPPENAPRIDEDAAMLLVDEKLASMNSTASCAREDIRAAFEYMTSPLVASAIWESSVKQSGVVIVVKRTFRGATLNFGRR